MSLFPLVSILILVAAVSSYANYRYVKLPTTVGVMLVALVASLALVSRVDFNQVVLHGMLAFLLFAGAIHVNLEELACEWSTISSLAIFGTLTSTFIVGGVKWLVLGWLGLGVAFLPALLFGALISPTDPIRFGIERLGDRGKFLQGDQLVHLVKELFASSGLGIGFNGRFCEGWLLHAVILRVCDTTIVAPRSDGRSHSCPNNTRSQRARGRAAASAGCAGAQGDYLPRPRESADDRGSVGRGVVGFEGKQSAHADLAATIRAVLVGDRFVSPALRYGKKKSNAKDLATDFHEGSER